MRLGTATVLLAAMLSTAGPAVAAGGADAETVGGERLGTSGLVLDAPEADALPKVSGDAWVLADLDTGEVLAARDPHGRFRPASVLKILTAVTTLPKLEPDAVYTAQWEDANAEGSRVGLVPDATYTVHNLFEALFLVSGNDAANAIANAAGGVKATVAEMNTTARDLGALDTRARNPSGLDAPGQFTSAYDMAVIARAAMAREDVRTYVSTVKSQFPGKMPRAGKVRKTFEIYTQDRLLLNYRGAIGVKTGWTTKARGTFVGAAQRGGRTLVATVLHSEGDAWRDSAALLSWGFRNAQSARPVGTLDAVQPASGEAAGPATSERPDTQASGEAVQAGTSGGNGMPWWLQTLVVILGVVVVLRGRVLLRARLRRARRAAVPTRMPQSRDRASREARADRRRVTSAAAAAPTPTPTAAPRQDLLRADEPEAPSTSSASTGTAS